MTKTARLYGSGLYDLAVEEGLGEELMQQTEAVRKLFRENPDYVSLLGEPSIPIAERIHLIDEAFAASTEHYLVNFIKLLCERNLLGEFGQCCEEYARRYCQDNGIAEACVTSAVKLTKEQEDALRAKLEAKSGKTVRLKVKVDPKVVAGLRVEMDGVEWDGTVQGRLSALSRKLSEITV